MAKGYWIGHITVTDADAFARYRAANGVAFDKFEGKFLVRGGAFDIVSGASRERHVMIEFPTHAAAVACFKSPEYRAAKAILDSAATYDLIIVEGV